MIEKCCRTCRWNKGTCLAPNSEHCSETAIDENVCDEYICKYERWIQKLGKEPVRRK